MVVALVLGEFALIAVARFFQWLVSPLVVSWCLATVVVTIGGFLIFGLPILHTYKDTTTRTSTETDIRGVWAERILRHGSHLAYVGASVVGGSPAVAWYYGSRGDPHAKMRTLGAAAITAAFWVAFYLGLLKLIFG
jgi:hypothetical protein